MLDLTIIENRISLPKIIYRRKDDNKGKPKNVFIRVDDDFGIRFYRTKKGFYELGEFLYRDSYLSHCNLVPMVDMTACWYGRPVHEMFTQYIYPIIMRKGTTLNYSKVLLFYTETQLFEYILNNNHKNIVVDKFWSCSYKKGFYDCVPSDTPYTPRVSFHEDSIEVWLDYDFVDKNLGRLNHDF